MAFPLALILPALLPAVADGLRGVFTRLTGGAGARPANTTEVIALMEAEAKYAEAMSKLDQPHGQISRWVSDLRSSFRYIAAGVVIVAPYGLLVWEKISGIAIGTDLILNAQDLSTGAWSFVFGDRAYAYMRRHKA